MPTAPPTFRPHGRSEADRRRAYDQDRGTPSERLYTARWRKAAKHHLRGHPLCAYCALEGRVGAATLVDHLYPHRGDVALFWNAHYWISACKRCHDGFKQSLEHQGAPALNALALRLNLPLLA